MLVLHAGGRRHGTLRHLAEDRVVHFHLSEDLEEVVRGDPAGPQDAGHPGAQGEDRGLDAHFTGAAVHHCGYLPVHVVQDVLRRRGRRHAGGVGAGGREGRARRLDDGPRVLVGRHADGDGVETGSDFVRNEVRLLEDDREGAGPERVREVLKDRGHEGREVLHLGQFGDVHDEGVVPRPSLGLEDAGHGFPVQSVRGETVDRLRGDGHQFARSEQFARAFDILFGVGKSFRLQAITFFIRRCPPLRVSRRCPPSGGRR